MHQLAWKELSLSKLAISLNSSPVCLDMIDHEDNVSNRMCDYFENIGDSRPITSLIPMFID